MSIKKYVALYTGMFLLSAVAVFSVHAEDHIYKKVSFTARVDLGSGLASQPSASVFFTVRDSGEDMQEVTLVFEQAQNLLFVANITNNSIHTNDFNEKNYFPNDIIVSFGLTGIGSSKLVTLQGEAVIPAEKVSSPGIEYYIQARDSKTSILFYGTSIGDAIPHKDSRLFIPISDTISITITPSGGTVIFPDPNPRDGEVQIVFPPGAVDAEIEISLRRKQEFLSPASFSLNTPIVMYDFQPDIKLNKGVLFSLLYPDVDSNPGIVDGTNVNETDLAVFWHDGFEWRPQGGRIDPDTNLISISIGHFSRYGIFSAAALSADQYRPRERIITPALADGINDFAQFDNLSGRDDVSINIFDITGRKIRTVRSPYMWDGKDDDGNIVETGVYIYQFNVDGTLISGTLAVAK